MLEIIREIMTSENKTHHTDHTHKKPVRRIFLTSISVLIVLVMVFLGVSIEIAKKNIAQEGTAIKELVNMISGVMTAHDRHDPTYDDKMQTMLRFGQEKGFMLSSAIGIMYYTMDGKQQDAARLFKTTLPRLTALELRSFMQATDKYWDDEQRATLVKAAKGTSIKNPVPPRIVLTPLQMEQAKACKQWSEEVGRLGNIKYLFLRYTLNSPAYPCNLSAFQDKSS